VTPLERIELSERVISSWEGHGQPGGPIPESLRMISEELARLLEVATAAPELSGQIDEIAYRYRLMEARLKRGLN